MKIVGVHQGTQIRGTPMMQASSTVVDAVPRGARGVDDGYGEALNRRARIEASVAALSIPATFVRRQRDDNAGIALER